MSKYKWVTGPIVVHSELSTIELSDGDGESIFLQMQDSRKLKANASRIVTAVNCLDELVAALSNLVKTCESSDVQEYGERPSSRYIQEGRRAIDRATRGE